MTRLLALVMVILLAVHFYQRSRLAIAKAKADWAATNNRSRDARTPKVLPLVPCAICGIRVAADLAIEASDGSGRYFCSPNCSNLDT